MPCTSTSLDRISELLVQFALFIGYVLSKVKKMLSSQLIFSGEFTKAMNKDWHSTHFCCWQCDESLTGQRYVLRDDHPYCIKCYESVFANPCEECNKIIGIDSKVRNTQRLSGGRSSQGGIYSYTDRYRYLGMNSIIPY